MVYIHIEKRETDSQDLDSVLIRGDAEPTLRISKLFTQYYLTIQVNLHFCFLSQHI